MSENENVEVKDIADATKFADEITKKVGPQLGGAITEAVDARIQSLGLDRVDRKAGIFPGVEGAGEEQPDPKQRATAFFRAALFGPGDGVSVKALAEGAPATGGYLVPEDFRSEVVMRTNELSVLYPRAFRFRTSLNSVKLPNLSTDVEMSWDEAENAAFGESDAAFGQTGFTIHRMNAITYSSRELLADSAVNLVDLLTQLFADAVSRERDKVICIGDGSTQPEGIFSATGIATVSSIGSITYDKLLEIDEKIAEQYRGESSLVWVTNQTVRRYVRGLKDDNGMPLLRTPLERGAPMTLLDHPILINKNVPAGYLALGVMGKYWIADREEMGFESTTTGGDTFKKHQIALKIWERWDGKLTYKTDCWVIGSGITG